MYILDETQPVVAVSRDYTGRLVLRIVAGLEAGSLSTSSSSLVQKAKTFQ